MLGKDERICQEQTRKNIERAQKMLTMLSVRLLLDQQPKKS